MSPRLLAVDFGSKRVGLALTDPLGLTIQPLLSLSFSTQKDLLLKLKCLVQERGIEAIVLGLPRSLDGTLGPKAVEYLQFAEKIKKDLGITVHLQDESFTSRDAEDILIRDLNLSRKKRKSAKDSMAACLILKSYLERL